MPDQDNQQASIATGLELPVKTLLSAFNTLSKEDQDLFILALIALKTDPKNALEAITAYLQDMTPSGLTNIRYTLERLYND